MKVPNPFKEWCDEYVRVMHTPSIEHTPYDTFILWSPFLLTIVIIIVAIIFWAYIDDRKRGKEYNGL